MSVFAMNQPSPPSIGRRAKAGANLWLPAGNAVTLLYVLFIGLPLGAMVFRAATADGFLGSLTSPVAMQALRLSLVTSTASLAIIVALGTPFAYLLARRRSTLLRIVDSLVELPIILPPVVAGVAMLMAFGRRGILGGPLEAMGIAIPFTTVAVLFAQVFIAAPFYIRAAKIGFQSVPHDLEDLSQTLGLSPWRTFWRLTLPLARPALIGGMALAWARALSEFGATIMFAGNFMGRTQTMPLAILSAMESDINVALALSTLLLALSVAVLLAIGFTGRFRLWRVE